MLREDERALRQAAAWHARRPCRYREEIPALAELLLQTTCGRPEVLPALIHELAFALRHASVAAAINRMLREHNRRAVHGDSTPLPLGAKAEAFRRSFADRASWEWLGCL